MKAKLPKDAFAEYVAMGEGRSYEALGKRYGVTKRSVVKRAKKERWKEQLDEMEKTARLKARAALQESFDEMHTRHSKMLRAMAGRAVKGLQEYPITNGMDAIRAAEAVIKLERILAGEPSDHTQATVAEVSREEVRLLVTTRPVGTNGPDDY